eukprot:12640367-Alexandrium_andersonii.AAC.1
MQRRSPPTTQPVEVAEHCPHARIAPSYLAVGGKVTLHDLQHVSAPWFSQLNTAPAQCQSAIR